MKSPLFFGFLAFVIVCLVNGDEDVNISKEAQTRIVGGVGVQINEFPYQVSLRQITNGKNHHLCGGAIISPRHILTAAHCFIEVPGIKDPSKDLVVVAGTMFTTPGNGNIYRIKFATHHPNYKGTVTDSWTNDIGILTLQSDIPFNSAQNLVGLPSANGKANDVVIATGWGVTRYPSKLSSLRLLKASMKIVDNPKCQNLIETKIHDGQMCALVKKGVGLCVGDSGGPLVLNGNVIGIASWVIPCAQGVPDVFTRVYYYIDWIKSVMSKK